MAYKGIFRPKNPEKYRGNPSNIIYRSRWELRVMSYLDDHKDVVEWSSEEMFVRYKSPIDNKWHRYFPDFIVKRKNPDGTLKTLMIEIKPFAQTRPPEKKTKITRQYINEVKTWGINKSKWEYAEEYCKTKGWDFLILTEKDLGLKF